MSSLRAVGGGTFRTNEPESRWSSRQTLTQTTMLTLRSFPQTMLPNPMVREIAALAKNAELTVPLVDEVAADIFMGTFTAKWCDSAAVTSAFLTDRAYARYYDLPPPAIFASPQPARLLARLRGGKEIAEDFAALCKERAKEAALGDGSNVARNGAVLEQSQILTTHNLAPLVQSLDLSAPLATSVGISPGKPSTGSSISSASTVATGTRGC